MKIEPRRLFTYPVLAEGSDDYKACKFFAKAVPHKGANAAGNLVFDVDLSTDYAELNRLIADGIGLNSKDFARYRRYCENPTLQPILNTMIILPALVAVFNELKQDAQEHESDAWFSALQTVYKRQKIDFNKLLAANNGIGKYRSHIRRRGGGFVMELCYLKGSALDTLKSSLAQKQLGQDV